MCIYGMQVEVEFYGERFLFKLVNAFSRTGGNKSDSDCFFSPIYIHHSIKVVYVVDEFYDGGEGMGLIMFNI